MNSIRHSAPVARPPVIDEIEANPHFRDWILVAGYTQLGYAVTILLSAETAAMLHAVILGGLLAISGLGLVRLWPGMARTGFIVHTMLMMFWCLALAVALFFVLRMHERLAALATASPTGFFAVLRLIGDQLVADMTLFFGQILLVVSICTLAAQGWLIVRFSASLTLWQKAAVISLPTPANANHWFSLVVALSLNLVPLIVAGVLFIVLGPIFG